MFDTTLARVKSICSEVLTAEHELKSKIRKTKVDNGQVIDFAAKLSGEEYSVSDLTARVSMLATAAKSVDDAGDALGIPKTHLDAFVSKLEVLRKSIADASSVFQTIIENENVSEFDAGTLEITDESGAVHNVGNLFRAIFRSTDDALVAWYDLRISLKAPRIKEFGRMAALIEEQQSRFEDLHSQFSSLYDDANGHADAIESLLGKAKTEQSEVARLLESGLSEKKTIAEYAGEALEKVTSIREIGQEAAELSETVNTYQGSFESFEKQLAAREKKFQTENAELESIHIRLSEKEKILKRLQDESEALLRGATNVGLAGSFSKLQGKTNSELRWARFSFYVSIAVLIFLSLPLALYVFPSFQGLLKAILGVDVSIAMPKGAEGHTAPDVLGQVAARALLLIPGIWLVRFASARHERLFRLREHYSYKFSVASSVEGFKSQAPDFEEAIAAATFFELTFNPATRMDAGTAEARHPNPAMEWVMKKLESSTADK